MVSIESCSMSLVATKHLVEPPMSLSGRTIFVCPVLPRHERVSEWPGNRRVSKSFQDGNGRPAQRRLVDAGHVDRLRERVGQELDPFRVAEQRTTGRDDPF